MDKFEFHDFSSKLQHLESRAIRWSTVVKKYFDILGIHWTPYGVGVEFYANGRYINLHFWAGFHKKDKCPLKIGRTQFLQCLAALIEKIRKCKKMPLPIGMAIIEQIDIQNEIHEMLFGYPSKLVST